MSRLNRSVPLRYRVTRRRRQACETERVVFHGIAHILIKLSVEHAQAVHNLTRVSELVRQVREASLPAAANGPIPAQAG
jgi:hypothetical protein